MSNVLWGSRMYFPAIGGWSRGSNNQEGKDLLKKIICKLKLVPLEQKSHAVPQDKDCMAYSRT